MHKSFINSHNKKVIFINAGDYYVTKNPNELLSTVLGPCISACICDPYNNIGGINHFMLPFSETYSLRYGNHAMDILISEIIKQGGCKNKLQIKIIGGASVSVNMFNIGFKNIEFVKNYIKINNLNLIAEHLGGTNSRRINYCPFTGEVSISCCDTIIKI